MRLTRHVPKLLFAAAFLTCLLVMPATNLPVSDTPARLRVTHWLWTGESPGGSLPGRGGVGHPWFGVGQSLVMLPADVLVTGLTSGYAARATKEQAELIRFVGVSYLTFPLLNSLVVLLAFGVLRRLGFEPRLAATGSLGLLLLTTFLWHAQNNQENPLQLLLVLAGVYCVLGWTETKSAASLFVASLALGFNLLVRVTTAADLVCVFALPLLVQYFREGRDLTSFRRSGGSYLRDLSVYALPCALLFLALDRVYHWWRFGTFRGTYMGMYGALRRAQFPHFPADYPFNNDFLQGFAGPFVSPAKSVFLYDPLVVVTLLTAGLCWKRLAPQVKALVLCACLMLLATAAGYAEYFCWSGEASWGNRFTTVPVHLLALLALPLALSLKPRAGGSRRGRLAAGAFALAVVLSFALQLSSLVYASWVETVQAGVITARAGAEPTIPRQGEYCHVCLRVKNIAADATGNFYEWNLQKTAAGETIGPPNKRLIPFLNFASLPPKLGALIKAGWWLLLAASGLVFALLLAAVRRSPSPGAETEATEA